MNVGIIRFPGSNCDFDTLNFFTKFGHAPEFIWYKDTRTRAYDLLVLPGGFAFGDRLYSRATAGFTFDPGALALRSPVLKAIKKAAKAGVPILGICNGFQILVKAGLLPGVLQRNESKKFFCDYVVCRVSGASFFGSDSMRGKKFTIPVAHGYGRYMLPAGDRKKCAENGQIFLTYAGFNPNGSMDGIAGVCNKQKTIFGMMPHPERSPDGEYFMQAIESYVATH